MWHSLWPLRVAQHFKWSLGPVPNQNGMAMFFFLEMGVSKNWRITKIVGLFHGKSENKMDDLGYPHFRKPPNLCVPNMLSKTTAKIVSPLQQPTWITWTLSPTLREDLQHVNSQVRCGGLSLQFLLISDQLLRRGSWSRTVRRIFPISAV
jgi:hypothetical protein